MRERLDEMYGATLVTDVQKKGEQHIITIRLDVANERFLSDTTPLFEQALSLLAEVVLNPRLEEGSFAASVIENEKRSLTQRIQSVYDDKMRYANVRITEEMCKNEPFALTAFGTVEEVEAITKESIYTYYQNVLKNNQVDLYMVGAIDEKKALDQATTAFQALTNNHQSTSSMQTTPSPEVREERIVHEEQDVKQGKLHMGFRTYTTYC